MIIMTIALSIITKGVEGRWSVSAEPSHPQEAEVVSDQVEMISYTAINLYDLADRGHLQLTGPTLSPGAPGWRRLSSRTQLSGAFRAPETLRGKTVSWIEGKGGKISFPYSGGEQKLDELLIWLHPVASHQVVSIFLDEVLLENLSLKSKGRYYRLSLPKPLSQGEHVLRLYFRFTRPAIWGGRTPGAIGPLSFVPKGQKGQAPERWAGQVMHEQQLWGALFAPPPSSWRFFFFPPEHSSFKAHLYVPPFAPTTKFQVVVSTDSTPDRLLAEVVCKAGERLKPQSQELLVDLNDYQGQAIQLTLKTETVGPHPQKKHRPASSHRSSANIGWLNPRIDARYPMPRELPQVKRLIVWVIDGFNLERTFLNPDHLLGLPSIKFLMERSIKFSRLWSDNLASQGGQHLLLQPPHVKESLPSQLKRIGGYTSYIGSISNPVPDLDVPFMSKEFVDEGELEEHPHKALLMKVQQMSRLGQHLHDHQRFAQKHTPELIYIHSPQDHLPRSRYPFELTSLEQSWLDLSARSASEKRLMRLYLAHLKEIDYTLAQLLSEVSLEGLETSTAILLVGSTGTPGKVISPSPAKLKAHIETSALLYHPQIRKDLSSFPIDGAPISALHDTLSALLLSDQQFIKTEGWTGSLAPFYLGKVPLPPLVSRAQRGTHLLTRIRDFYLFEPSHGTPRLWYHPLDHHTKHSSELADLSQSHPILLRTLRDGLGVSPLVEGLNTQD